jgi:hypothetical protein
MNVSLIARVSARYWVWGIYRGDAIHLVERSITFVLLTYTPFSHFF